MAKKSFLDSIDVPKPCDASWDKMLGGGDKKRFCMSCKKDVYNLSGMPRREARKLVATSAGKICVRYARLPNGKVLTTDRKLHQISRRTSAVAAGVIATTISLSAMTYAQGEPVTNKVKAKEKEVAEQNKINKEIVGTSQISFTVYDSTGEVIPNAEVKLTNEKRKKEFIILADENGVARFSLLPKARYKLQISSSGFQSEERYIQLNQPIEPNIKITLELPKMFVVGDFIVRNKYEIPFFEAIAQEDIVSVKSLVFSGFDLSTKDKRGETALHVAVKQGNLEIVKLLLKKGANANAKMKDGRTPIWMINDEENGLEIFKLLTSKGADINALNQYKETLLMLACEDNSLEGVEFLLKAGANPNLKDEDDETAFMKTDSEEIKQLLIRYGARK